AVPPDAAPPAAPSRAATAGKAGAGADSDVRARKSRLAPWEEQELEILPERISELEAEQASLAARLSDPELYRSGTEEAESIQQAIEAVEAQLESSYARWELL